MKEDWELKPTDNINQMLRIKHKVENKEAYPSLLIVKHQYHVADDVMFPDPACLAFFTAFEENHLTQFEVQGSMQLVAVDIFEGLMQFFIYCKEPQQSVHDSIAFLKSNPLYEVQFEIVPDGSWSRYEALVTL